MSTDNQEIVILWRKNEYVEIKWKPKLLYCASSNKASLFCFSAE